MQTTNDKCKNKLQQLFKMLSLSLDIDLESFSPLVSGPINDGQLQSATTLTTRCFSSARLRVVPSCMVRLLP